MQDDSVPLVSFVTSFNQRLFESSYQQIICSFRNKYPDTTLFVCHENSFEKKEYNRVVNFDFAWECVCGVDLFEIAPWLEKFLQESPLTKHKEDSSYWNKHAKYWFRKVVAMQYCCSVCRDDFLIWVDADTRIKSPISIDRLDYFEKFDICGINRGGQATESGIFVFNLKRGGKRFADSLLNCYLTGNAFLQKRWDDGFIIDVVRRNSEVKFGTLNPKMGCPFSIYDNICHFKLPFKNIRSKVPESLSNRSDKRVKIA